MFAIKAANAESSPSFSEFDQRAKRGETLTVAFLGGSLTWGAQATDPLKTSYRAIVSRELRDHYPNAHFTFVDAAIGGTGSQLGAFRLNRDVLAYEPDLVFLDFTVNDHASKVPEDDRLSSYESLIRRMLQADIPVVQVILAVKADIMPKPSVRPLDDIHKEIGAAYNLPLADVVTSMRKAVVDEARATPDELWDLPNDSTHPGDAGYALYAECVWETYLKAVEDAVVCQLPVDTLYPDHYMQVDRFSLAAIDSLPNGWKTGAPHRSAIAFDFTCSRWMDDLAIAEAGDTDQPEVLTVQFTGESVLLFGESTPKSGRYSVSIDGGAPVEYKAHCASGNMRLVQLLAYGLNADETHTLQIRPLLESGEELRLNSVCVAGGSVLLNKSNGNDANASKRPKPTYANLPYGTDERNVMDVWLAESEKPTPCVIHIHGGGWLGGDKSKVAEPQPFLDAGISYIAINYRFLSQTIIDTGSERGSGPIQARGDYPEPPINVPLYDAARALQFVRSKAAEWNINKERIGLTGGSAGACTSLWLAFHDDLADPDASDPVLRESTRVWCAAVESAQTTLDPKQLLEWTPNATYGGHAFGYVWDRSDFTVEIRSFLADRENVMDWIAEYSPYFLLTKDDPPVYLFYRDVPEKGTDKKDATHSSNYGAILVEKLDALGMDYDFKHGGVENPEFANCEDYLISKLKQNELK